MRIAVVGTGVSGLVAAHRLHRAHELVVFEAADRVGGHVHTHDVEREGRRYAVDSGFIVFNDRNYPGFRALLDELGVASQPSSMSFSVQCEETGLEYNGTNLNTLFAQRRNLFRPSFHRMIRDILRFHREAPELLEGCPDELTIGQYLERNRYGPEFVQQYILPMGASIWSGSPEVLARFPAGPFVRFFHNHGMLTVDDRPQWRVVQGGSRTYVEKLIAPFRTAIRTGTPVTGVRRYADHVEVTSGGGRRESYDHVILALHSDQARDVLADPSAAEREVLGALPYQENEAVLHTDASLLPRNRRAWAAWNYRIPKAGRPRVAITYDMDILQGFETSPPFCVTLNRSPEIDPARVVASMTYHHPQYTAEGFAARRRWAEISGVRRTHYCGAYWGYGFHEDGLQSGLKVARWFEEGGG